MDVPLWAVLDEDDLKAQFVANTARLRPAPYQEKPKREKDGMHKFHQFNED